MKRTIWVTAVTLTIALGICLFSEIYIQRFVTRARHLRTEAVEYMDRRDMTSATETMTRLAALLRESGGWLEILCDHDDLHEIKGQAIEAKTSIELGDIDDFYQAIYGFGEVLEHIADEQELRLSNLC